MKKTEEHLESAETASAPTVPSEKPKAPSRSRKRSPASTGAQHEPVVKEERHSHKKAAAEPAPETEALSSPISPSPESSDDAGQELFWEDKDAQDAEAARAMLDEIVEHGEHEVRLVDELFEDLEALHGLSEDWRSRLQQAARVHDVGYMVGHKGHQKVGMNMVLEERLPAPLSVKEEDRVLVALLVRYHRKSWPNKKHAVYAALGRKIREDLCAAASLLRIADALDFTHHRVVESLSASVRKRKVVLTLQAQGDCVPEMERALLKGDLFEALFDRKLSCEL